LKKFHNDKQNLKRSADQLMQLENLYSHQNIIPEDFSAETEEEYFSLLKSNEVGKAITNVAEYLLETEGILG